MTANSALRLGYRIVRYELRLYLSLGRWMFRRPSIPAAYTPIGYAQAVTPVMSLWIFASAMEVPLFHALVPWHTVRIAGLAVGVWGLIWMLGLLASLRVYPHLFDASVLRVRNGPSVDIAVPWDVIASLTVRRADLPSSIRTLQPEETESGTHLRVAVSGQVNVHARLERPVEVRTPHGPLTIVELSFLVDDPRAFVREGSEYVDAATTVNRARRPDR